MLLLMLLRLIIVLQNHENTSKLDKSFELAVAIRESQTPATNWFIRVSARHWDVAPLGININLSHRHTSSLAWLLIVSGDVELLPGPETCDKCGRSFQQKKNLTEHINLYHGTETASCHQCDFQTKYPSNLKRHVQNKHVNPKPVVVKAAKQPSTVRPPPPPPPPPTPACKTTAFKKLLATYRLDGNGDDPELFFHGIAPQIEAYAEAGLQEKTGIKLQIAMVLKFYMPHNLTEEIVRHYWSDPMPLYRGTEFDVTNLFPRIMTQIDEFQKQGSGWSIKEIQFVTVNVVTCRPLRGSCSTALPQRIKATRAVVNIHNKDNKCFMYCMRAAFEKLPAKSNHNRVSKYRKTHGLNFNGIEFPVDFKGISKFEKQNPGIRVNVYGFDEEIFPYRISPEENGKVVHLLLYNSHYFHIRSLNSLLSHMSKHKGRLWFCHRCLSHTSSKKSLKTHMQLCQKMEPTRICMPEPGSKLKFNSVQKTLRAPVVIYADLECLITKTPPDNSSCTTEKLNVHTPCGYGLQVVRNCCGKPSYDEPEVYRGPDCIEKFLLSISQIAIDYQNMLRFPAAMVGVKDESSQCHICKTTIDGKKVRDHCHICGQYRGSAHNECNQAYKLSRDIVVVFHNLRKYDGHLLMERIGTISKLQGFDIDVIAKTMESYISFSLKHKKEPGVNDKTYRIRFIDSLEFLNSSLSGLVDNLPPDQFKVLEEQKLTDYQKRLLRRKGVYPYEYMDSWTKFSEGLPKKELFYSKLTENHISEEDYAHAKSVWKEFEITDMGDYHDLYLKTDVLLLTDVFEEFRSFSLKTYGLDPAHYVTTPSLAFDACLKLTGVSLELFSDIDMYLFCEQGIRGGISMISHRYAKANNKYLLETYDPNVEPSFIMLFDANNLYGHSMSSRLPLGGFEWIKDKIRLATTNWFEDGPYGYILDVDLEYPPDLHTAHNDYPLAPEHMEINSFSNYCEYLKNKLGIRGPAPKKLVPNLFNKQNYIIHHRTLKLYLDLGMKLVKVNRALKFQQDFWMRDYINLNTEMRKSAKNSFEKDLFKLFNNSVFGKCLENPRHYKQVELVTTGPRFEKLTANPRYRTCCRFNEDLVGVCMLRPSVTLNKPIYCGFTVLELSKELMFDFHYSVIVPKYGKKAKLLFTDTDSLCYHISTEDVYKDMQTMAQHFDFSDYPEEHFLHDTINKKVLGKMKDETSSIPIEEFCGLRSKMYSIKFGRVEKKRAKGIKKTVVQRCIKHEDYKRTLFDECTMKHQMTYFKSYCHKIHTVKVTKRSLSAYDDKRWLLNPVESKARGHYLNFEENCKVNENRVHSAGIGTLSATRRTIHELFPPRPRA